ncbi:flagellar basal body-associated FliL family protein [Eubacteriales bacterium OttesenSCG-928-N14]|nr:flagellar basal body-associated FliL family protein [Eubacteriales bacterium OttesenSCG-928-N14]
MNKKVLIIIIAAVVVVGAAAAFLLLSGDSEPTYVQYEPGEQFITNIKESSRFIRVVVVLEVEEGAMEALEANQPIVRNAILFLLRDKKEDEYRSADIERVLRDEIIQKVSEAMGFEEGVIQNVYFNDFVIS